MHKCRFKQRTRNLTMVELVSLLVCCVGSHHRFPWVVYPRNPKAVCYPSISDLLAQI